MPPEALDALNDVVDAVLANPERYDELRAQYIEQGLPDDILPEQFDPQFFAALNMAVDQMIAAPTGVQAFAKGGIAELKPIAKAIASYGRNGDTMLAHITPAEARMLRRRGGSGTINPDTGLPEFFLKKAFRKVKKAIKSVGRAVKKFASSTVGRLVATVALGFFLGPAAASLAGVGAGTAAGVAISGFVGSAGSTLLGGGSLRDALKAGAIGGLTAGAGAALAGAPLTGAATMTPAQALQGQVDKFTGGVKGLLAPAPVVDAPAAVPGTGVQTSPIPESINTSKTGTNFFDQPAGAPVETMAGTLNPNYTNPPPPQGSSMFDSAKKFVSEKISPSGIREGATPGAQQAGIKAVTDYKSQMTAAGITPTGTELTGVYNKAFNAAMPGTLATYAPAVGAGLGIMALGGGFETKEPTLSPEARALLDRDKDRVKIGDRPDQFYIQNLPGVKYDEKGAIIGSTPYTPTPTSLDDIRVPARSLTPSPSAGMGMGMPSVQPPVYSSGQGTMGLAPQITQPYNTSSMYADLMAPPRRFADGGGVGYPMAGIASLAKGGYPRRTGQISGPGTEKSDSIPAMLSDGEFVMTAKAVRGAGKGSRRAGAKKMYDLMHQLERNASRG
jgi:hypothetical protein